MTSGELPESVAVWLSDALPGTRIINARTLSGGYRNENVAVTTHLGDAFVLRRYRDGDRCGVEQWLAHRLNGLVPVPEVVAADIDGSVAGEPVLLSRFVVGARLDSIVFGLSQREATRLGRRLGSVLAAIGTVEFAAAGFFSGPDLSFARTDSATADLAAFARLRMNDVRGLTEIERAALLRLAADSQPWVDSASGDPRLVHADFNTKNVLVAQHGGEWDVAAVLDWEFAFSGNPLSDVANLLRFPDDLTPEFAEGFVDAYGSESGRLLREWREIGAALDMFSLLELLTLPEDHPVHVKAVAKTRQLLT